MGKVDHIDLVAQRLLQIHQDATDIEERSLPDDLIGHIDIAPIARLASGHGAENTDKLDALSLS